MIKRQWRYTDSERDPSIFGKCYDCELPYEQFTCELVIDHDMWERINPTQHKGSGLLCHNCMIERLLEIEAGIVEVLHFSVSSPHDA